MSESGHIESFPRIMLGYAKGQLGHDQHAAAILLAQAAVEMLATDAFTSLIGEKLMTPVNPVLDLVPDFSFMDKGTRELWLALTGEKISEPKDVWGPYHKHVERRNRVAHGFSVGDGNGGQDARDSVAAATALMDKIEATMLRLGY